MEFLIFSDNEIYPLNKEELKNLYLNGNLKDSNIFAELFKLNNTNFKEENMIKDKSGYISICKFLNITGKNWSKFLTFIKSGRLNYSEDLETLKIISNKLGGIPFIDNYSIKEIYNPTDPKDDYKEKYIWKVCYLSDSLKNLVDFEFAKILEKNNMYGIFRKLKQ